MRPFWIGGFWVLDTEYWPLAVYMLSALLLVGGVVGISALLGEHHCERATGEPFECGMPPTSRGRAGFPASFYVMAVVFVVFDIETVLFVSWAVVARGSGWGAFAEIVLVGVLLVAALLYLWRGGALDWGLSESGPERADNEVNVEREDA
jgi:NADH-quinone oxidoreductase subunit A